MVTPTCSHKTVRFRGMLSADGRWLERRQCLHCGDFLSDWEETRYTTTTENVDGYDLWLEKECGPTSVDNPGDREGWSNGHS